jgi:hypothetical protein
MRHDLQRTHLRHLEQVSAFGRFFLNWYVSSGASVKTIEPVVNLQRLDSSCAQLASSSHCPIDRNTIPLLGEGRPALRLDRTDGNRAIRSCAKRK